MNSNIINIQGDLEECAICLQEQGAHRFTCNCKSFFCLKCIRKVERHPEAACPFCRFKIPKPEPGVFDYQLEDYERKLEEGYYTDENIVWCGYNQLEECYFFSRRCNLKNPKDKRDFDSMMRYRARVVEEIVRVTGFCHSDYDIEECSSGYDTEEETPLFFGPSFFDPPIPHRSGPSQPRSAL